LLIGLLVVLGRDGRQPASAAVDLTPNLKALPARQLLMEQAGGTVKLRFSVTSWNGGAGVLELWAGEVDNQAQKQRVYQRIYATDGSFREVMAGSFVWHPTHFHTHFEDYALYTLRPVGAPGGSSRMGSKTTFCVMDTDLIDGSLPGSPSSAVYNSCNNTLQGMSVGWGDTYSYQLPGQEIDVTGLTPGDYYLSVDVDPANRIEEGDETDNSSTILVRLDPAAGTAVVLPDADGDGVTDAEDNCRDWANAAQDLPAWPVWASDPDCDGWSESSEATVGTDPLDHCNDTTGTGDEPLDAWPTDFDDSRMTNLSDVVMMGPVYNQSTGTDPAKKRFDLNASGTVNLSDVVMMGPFYNKGCG
jgi:hypothetical protein